MPVVAIDLDIGGGYTWAFSAYIVASLLATVVGGVWSDAAGPRDPLIASVVIFGIGATTAGLAGSMPVFVLGRAIEGLGGGVLIVGLYVVVARAFSIEMRPRVFSVISASWVVPSVVGPLLAGWLADNLSWRAVFLLVPVVILLPTILLFPTLKGLHQGVPQFDAGRRVLAGVLATAGLLAVQDGLLRLNTVGAMEALLGLLALVVGLRRLLPEGALRMRRGLPASVMMRGFLAASFFSAEVFIPLALVQQRGVTTTGAGLVLAVSAGSWFVGSYAQSRLPGHDDRSRVVRIGSVIIAGALLTLPFALMAGLPPWTAAISWAIASFGMGLALPSVAVQVLRLSPEADQGANSAAIQITDAVMSTLAISLLGVGYAAAVLGGGVSAQTYTLLWTCSAFLALAGALVAGRMRPAT